MQCGLITDSGSDADDMPFANTGTIVNPGACPLSAVINGAIVLPADVPRSMNCTLRQSTLSCKQLARRHGMLASSANEEAIVVAVLGVPVSAKHAKVAPVADETSRVLAASATMSTRARQGRHRRRCNESGCHRRS